MKHQACVALEHWAAYHGAPLVIAAGGLINQTWFVGSDVVLQRLHPVLGAEVNLDITALVPHLLAAGVVVPELIPTDRGEASVVAADGGVWRMLRRLPGVMLQKVEMPSQAASAAGLLAEFHDALRELDYSFKFARLQIHDTAKHFRVLKASVQAFSDHRLHKEVVGLAAGIDALWRSVGTVQDLPARIGHGDPKISNFLFDISDRRQASSILDLDTMGWTTLDAELGDALRSWCNCATEDAPEPVFECSIFEAAVGAYLDKARGWIQEAERQALPSAAARIAVELSSRFAADALGETYFGWDAERYESRGAHNLARARSQLALAEQIVALQPTLSALM